MIELNRVSKTFKGGVVALSDVSVRIQPGVTALLGPNGAGKSTLFRVLAGLTAPTLGTATVMDKSLRSDVAARALVGLVPQQDELFEHMTAADFVTMNATLAGVRDPRTAARTALDEVHLADAADRRLGGFSKGMRQRIKIASAIAPRPPVLLLDEPLNGLDPVQRGRMIDLFKQYGADGVTVVVSSHVLEEVAEIGSNVVMLMRGRLAATGAFRELRRLMTDRPQNVLITTDQPRRFAALILEHQMAHAVSVSSTTVNVQTDDVVRLETYVARMAYDHDLALNGMELTDDSLEAVFHYLTAPLATGPLATGPLPTGPLPTGPPVGHVGGRP